MAYEPLPGQVLGHCGNCRWWVPTYSHKRTTASLGQCHGGPPTAVVIPASRSSTERTETAWPQTRRRDWCGSYEAIHPNR